MKKDIYSKDPSPLPSSRSKQFIFLIRNHFLLLFASSMTFFLFLIPLFLSGSIFHIQFNGLIRSDSPSSHSLFLSLLFGGASIGVSIIFAELGACGLNGIVSKLMINNGAKYQDYWLSIKNEWLSFLIYGLIEGILIFLVFGAYAIYMYQSFSAVLKLISLIASCLLLFLFWLGKPYFYIERFYFDNSIFLSIKASIELGIAGIFLNLALLVASNALLVAMLFSPWIAISIEMLLFILFGGAFNSLLNLVFAFDYLEKKLPRTALGSLYHKGLDEGKGG